MPGIIVTKTRMKTPYLPRNRASCDRCPNPIFITAGANPARAQTKTYETGRGRPGLAIWTASTAGFTGEIAGQG